MHREALAVLQDENSEESFFVEGTLAQEYVRHVAGKATLHVNDPEDAFCCLHQNA